MNGKIKKILQDETCVEGYQLDMSHWRDSLAKCWKINVNGIWKVIPVTYGAL